MSFQTPEKDGTKVQPPSSIVTLSQIRRAQSLITAKYAQKARQSKPLVVQQRGQNR